MEKLLYIIVLASLCAITAGLRCYICEDCPLPDTSALNECVSTASTSESSTSEPSTKPSTEPDSSSLPSDVYNTRRKRRSVQDESISNRGCNCYSGYCDCSVKHMATRADETKFQCYKLRHEVNNVWVIDRGCTEIPDESLNACSVLGVTAGCNWCDFDECNSALTLQICTALLICLPLLSRYLNGLLV